jgi:Flp pilus assembly protein TadB
VLVAHVGHWIWELLLMAPFLLLALVLLVAELMDRRAAGRYRREAEEWAERELDEILSS